VSIALVVALTACSSNPLSAINPFGAKEDESKRGTIGFVEGFLGGVATDEPRATLTGRDILSAGGTAADAAAAVALTLSVTMPSSASLGGGGVCIVHDRASKRTEAIDFQAAGPSRMAPGAVHPTAVPGFVRGIAAMQAKYGRLPWSQVVAPAEKLARFGIQVSRAFAADLRKAAPTTMTDPEMRRIFVSGKGGAVVKEGDFIKQLDLSSVLGRIRARGGGDFYIGSVARQFVAAVVNAGGSLTVEDMRAYAPQWRPTIKVPYVQAADLHFPAPPGPAGVLAAQMMSMLIKHGGWESASPEARAHVLAEVSGRAFAGRDRWLAVDGRVAADAASLIAREATERLLAGYRADRHAPTPTAVQGAGESPDIPTGTGFVVADREGSGVACSLTLNNLFGTGRVAQGMGIILAALPGPRGRGPDSLAPMMLTSELHNTFYLAAAASGGSAAPSALIGVAARALLGRKDETLTMAVAGSRIHNDGVSGVTYHEQGLDAAVVQSLASKGHRVGPVAAIGLVNAIFCPTGVPTAADSVSCAVKSDPRSFGLAVGSD